MTGFHIWPRGQSQFPGGQGLADLHLLAKIALDHLLGKEVTLNFSAPKGSLELQYFEVTCTVTGISSALPSVWRVKNTFDPNCVPNVLTLTSEDGKRAITVTRETPIFPLIQHIVFEMKIGIRVALHFGMYVGDPS